MRNICCGLGKSSLSQGRRYYLIGRGKIKLGKLEQVFVRGIIIVRTTAGNYQLHFGQGTKLTVKANIQNPQPALYQLRSPKSSNTSVCLLTDFGFYNGSIKNETVTGSEATVLEMMTMESKSYGAVTWGSKSNFTCTDAFRKDMFDFNQFSGSKCNSSHAEQGFETDRDLNLMNLSLIVLRIIFLKTVGFNLLMTLRLWSN